MRRPESLTRTEVAVLGLLAWAGESSGYDLHKRALRSVGFIWAPARSHLYAVLKRLAAAGLVRERHVAQVGRPDKRLFVITADGRTALRAWLNEAEPIEPEDRDGILLKVFFAAFGDPARTREQLLDYRDRAAGRLGMYREIEQGFEGEAGPAALQRLQTLRFGIALMEASVSWVDETLEVMAGAAEGRV